MNYTNGSEKSAARVTMGDLGSSVFGSRGCTLVADRTNVVHLCVLFGLHSVSLPFSYLVPTFQTIEISPKSQHFLASLEKVENLAKLCLSPLMATTPLRLNSASIDTVCCSSIPVGLVTLGQ